jgi:hypothetical protein
MDMKVIHSYSYFILFYHSAKRCLNLYLRKLTVWPKVTKYLPKMAAGSAEGA